MPSVANDAAMRYLNLYRCFMVSLSRTKTHNSSFSGDIAELQEALNGKSDGLKTVSRGVTSGLNSHCPTPKYFSLNSEIIE